MLGASISDEKLKELKSDIAQIEDPGLRSLLSKGIFKHNKVNNALDAALWLVANANVVCIPMAAQKGKEDVIKLRFSVGQTSVETIKKAMGNIKTALETQLPKPEKNLHAQRASSASNAIGL